MDRLQALRTFVRVIETGSFAAAAREINTSHSSVARQVSALEEHFGARLLQRTTRRLSLTEDGQDLLQYGQRMIQLDQELEGALGRQRTSPTGLVRIGVTTAGAILMTPRLRGLMDDYPALSIELVVRDQFGDLIEERLDVALHVGQPPDSSLLARRIGAFGRALVAAPAYLKKRGEPARPADLVDHDCIIHKYGSESTQWHFKGPDGRETIRVQGRFHANNAAVVRRAVLDGDGVAMVPEALIVDDVRLARLYRLLPDYQTERLPAFLLYPSRRHLPPRTRVVIEAMAREAAKIAARLAEDDLRQQRFASPELLSDCGRLPRLICSRRSPPGEATDGTLEHANTSRPDRGGEPSVRDCEPGGARSDSRRTDVVDGLATQARGKAATGSRHREAAGCPSPASNI